MHLQVGREELAREVGSDLADEVVLRDLHVLRRYAGHLSRVARLLLNNRLQVIQRDLVSIVGL